MNLAITLAQSGLRVLLVDTDMRRPRLHKAFGIPATPDGLSRAILGEAPVLDAGARDRRPQPVAACRAARLPPNPAELLHAERFKRIVGELAGAFDRVIFDSPPVGPVTDAAILARITDGTILVAKFGATSKDGLRRARRQLVDGGVNVLGCILNDLDLSQRPPSTATTPANTATTTPKRTRRPPSGRRPADASARRRQPLVGIGYAVRRLARSAYQASHRSS